MDYHYRQLAAFDHNLCTGAHTRQHLSKVAGGFRFRDVDHVVSHDAIIPSFLLVRFSPLHPAEVGYSDLQSTQVSIRNLKQIHTATHTGATLEKRRLAATDGEAREEAQQKADLLAALEESSDSFVASAAASLGTGWSEPVPGRDLHPLKSSAFHGALFRQLRTDHALGGSEEIVGDGTL